MLELNNLTSDAWIYPGDELLIRAPVDTPTATMVETQITPMVTLTLRPRRTITQQAYALTNNTTPTESVRLTKVPDQAVVRNNKLPTYLLLIIAAVVIVGIGLVFLGKVFKRME